MTTLEDLTGAQGKFALFVASLLQRAGVATMAEFGTLLAAYADTIAETDPGEAEVLRQWASGLPNASVG